jgi:hypothetical protein
MAALPQSICSYAWKMPPARPAIFERAQKLTSRGEAFASQAEQSSIPWKAYLAEREFQHLALDLAEALFAAVPSAGAPDAERPASLMLGGKLSPLAGTGPARGLLAAALPEGAGADSQESGPNAQPCALSKAA